MSNLYNLANFIQNPPFRTKSKIKHLLKEEFNTTISDKDLFFTGPPVLNNININKAKKEFSHKIVSIPGGFVGDLLFPLEDRQSTLFLILVEINSRKVFAQQIYSKSVNSILPAFKKLQEQYHKRMTILLFDQEKAIMGNEFQKIFS